MNEQINMLLAQAEQYRQQRESILKTVAHLRSQCQHIYDEGVADPYGRIHKTCKTCGEHECE